MTRPEPLPTFLTPRGWGLIAASVVSLAAAQVLGRRDLLYLGVFLVLLPLTAAVLLRTLRPRFRIGRVIDPDVITAGSTTGIRLHVACTVPYAGTVTMTERVPPRFGDAPSFAYPGPELAGPGRSGPGRSGAGRGAPSRYEYRLRAGRRGSFAIGPVTAEFTDPFGLSRCRHTLGGQDRLTVTPAAVELTAAVLTGARNSEGPTSTRTMALPSDEDATTREYRHGDPMRRVHWPATARHGTLMVRQEESVTTVQATLVLDQRAEAYDTGLSVLEPASEADGPATCAAFEWQVTAAASTSAHLIDRGFRVRVLDAFAAPGLRRSPSAPHPDRDEYASANGYADLAESLAALGLADEPGHGTDAAGAPFGDPLLGALSEARQRGPVIALLGAVTEAEASRLAPAARFCSAALAIAVVGQPARAKAALRVLHDAGWQAVAVDPGTPVAAAWARLRATAESDRVR